MAKTTIEEIASLLFTTARSVSMREGSVGEIEPYSQARLEALNFINEKGQPTMKDLAKHFSVSPPSATALVGKLVKDKQITRIADKNDRRIVRLSITAKGEHALEQGFAKKVARLKLTFSPLDAAEREELARMLRKIADYYQKN